MLGPGGENTPTGARLLVISFEPKARMIAVYRMIGYIAGHETSAVPPVLGVVKRGLHGSGAGYDQNR